MFISIRPLFLPPPLLTALLLSDNITTLCLIGTLSHTGNSINTILYPSVEQIELLADLIL